MMGSTNIQAKANQYISSFANVMGKSPEISSREGIKVGVDLGTANICIAVLNQNDVPITGEIVSANVVRDGLVVEYIGAVSIVRRMKERIERRLGRALHIAAAAVPPGTVGKNADVVANVVRAADMDVVRLVDEPAAAAKALGIQNGAVIDAGGGTTGISVLQDGTVTASYDEPTGGTHMTLVLAGHYGIPVEEAEKIKLDPARQGEVFSIVRPVAERMGRIAAGCLADIVTEQIVVVGGAAAFEGFENVIAQECGQDVWKPVHSLLVTPLGIAMYGNE